MADNPQRRIFSMDTERVLKLERENAQLRAIIASREDEIHHQAAEVDAAVARAEACSQTANEMHMLAGTYRTHRDAAQATASRLREALEFIKPTINRLSEGSLELHELDLRIDRALGHGDALS